MKKFLFPSILLSLFIFTSCGSMIIGNAQKAKGPIVSKQLNAKDYNKINFFIPGKLILKQADAFKMRIEAPDDCINDITVEVKNGLLTIKLEKNWYFTDKEIICYISAPELSSISTSASGNIEQNGHWDFKKINFNTFGSGDIYFYDINITEGVTNNINGSGTIVIENIKITKNMENIIEGSGDIEIKGEILTDKITSKIHGSGDIVLNGDILSKIVENDIRGSGDIYFSSNRKCDNINVEIHGSGTTTFNSPRKADNINIKVRGSGDVIAKKITAAKGDIDINGSGDVYVSVTDFLKVGIFGSGDVYYNGNPDKIDLHIEGSGDVHSSN